MAYYDTFTHKGALAAILGGKYSIIMPFSPPAKQALHSQELALKGLFLSNNIYIFVINRLMPPFPTVGRGGWGVRAGHAGRNDD